MPGVPDDAVRPLLGLRPVAQTYRRGARTVLEQFRLTTQFAMAGQAAAMCAPLITHWFEECREDGDFYTFAEIFSLPTDAHERALTALHQRLAGTPAADEADIARDCHDIANEVHRFDKEAYPGAGLAAWAFESLIDAIRTPRRDLTIRLAGAVRLAFQARNPGAFDCDDPTLRDEIVAEWWSTCTRRLAFADVFTAEIELGEPPEPWPGDDPAHLARVAAWEAMSDEDRQAAIERHQNRHQQDVLELGSGRVVHRAWHESVRRTGPVETRRQVVRSRNSRDRYCTSSVS